MTHRRRRWPWILGLLLFGLCAVVALGWESDRTVEALKPHWAQAPSEFIDLQGMRVHLRDQGQRSVSVPQLLLHDTSASLHTWEPWVAALEAQRRVVSVDLPGFGLTGPDPQRDYRIERYVDFVHALMEERQIQRAVLVGNSLGGWIAWEFALAHPEQTDRLVLVDPAGYGTMPQEIPIGFRLARHEWTRPLLEHLLPRSLVRGSVEQVYGDPSLVSEDLVDRYFELSLREGNRGALFDRFSQGLGSPANRERTAQISCPTLILWGEQDRLIPPADGHKFAEDIPSSQLVVLPGLGHVPHEEAPTASLAAVTAFLQSAVESTTQSSPP